MPGYILTFLLRLNSSPFPTNRSALLFLSQSIPFSSTGRHPGFALLQYDPTAFSVLPIRSTPLNVKLAVHGTLIHPSLSNLPWSLSGSEASITEIQGRTHTK